MFTCAPRIRYGLPSTNSVCLPSLLSSCGIGACLAGAPCAGAVAADVAPASAGAACSARWQADKASSSAAGKARRLRARREWECVMRKVSVYQLSDRKGEAGNCSRLTRLAASGLPAQP
ncbi:hypothetical protein D3C81_1544630 [compost metagenome]